MGERLALGQTYRLEIPVDDGAETNPAPLDPATLTVTIRSSAGVAVLTHPIGNLTKLGVGSYLDLITTGAGNMLTAADTYSVEVRSTTPDSFVSDWLDVVDATPAVITLADAKEQTDKTKTKRAGDAELQVFVDAVNGWLADKVGEVVPRTVSDEVVPVYGVVMMPRRPVLAIVSATYAGVAVDVSSWRVTANGKLTVPSGLYPQPSTGAGLVVTYRVGRSPIPPTIPLAGRMLVQHLWKSQRTQTAAPVAGGFSDDTVTVAGIGYAIPNRVAELVQDRQFAPGVA